MTRRMQEIIFECYRQGDPFVQGIREEEIPELIDKFRHRLSQSAGKLDTSSNSLKNLHKTLIRYVQQTATDTRSFSEEENLQIVREITAYLGSVTVNNLGGHWYSSGNLLTAGVALEGRFEAVKGNEIRKLSKTIINLGYFAAGIWDCALKGIDVDIMQSYKRLTKKRIKEHLG